MVVKSLIALNEWLDNHVLPPLRARLSLDEPRPILPAARIAYAFRA